MSKIISPLLVRNKNIKNYLNNIHIKVYKKLNNLNYFKFFQILLNFIYLFKIKISKYKFINKKLLYINCNYYDFYNFNININLLKLPKSRNSFLFYKMYTLSTYINYYIKFYLYSFNLFLWVLIKYPKHFNTNPFYILYTIKKFIIFSGRYSAKIINFFNYLISIKYNNYYNIKGLKCVYSGCLNKGGSKKKIYRYTVGLMSTSSVEDNILYIKDTITTSKGVIGIKLWIRIK
uniref:Ribosomal protein S3 n=1 Tax=Babesia duncani TaxID=323732 RepID=A0A385GNK6_9APIC|nr:ribosomal protein S3 [Babesia duncani]